MSTAGAWVVSHKADRRGCELADGHYSRRTVGAPQFMPPGQTLVLVSKDGASVFGWWRPHPRSGLRAMNGLDGWTCSIFRRTGGSRASDLILEAEAILADQNLGCGPDGLLTYVWDAKVQSQNPGYCFKAAGYHVAGRRPCCAHMRPRSADGKKTLLHKPFPGHPERSEAAPADGWSDFVEAFSAVAGARWDQKKAATRGQLDMFYTARTTPGTGETR